MVDESNDVRDAIGRLISTCHTVPPNLFTELRVVHDYNNVLIVADGDDHIWRITVERLSDDFS